ncbi:MAG: lytic transglycosylase [Desulfotalea sp.]|nr:MAG: lytic transglycosylase [Desulfotalea sp.]
MITARINHSREVRKDMGRRLARIFFCLGFVLTLTVLEYGTSKAAIYVCRDTSGKVNYTNVRNSANCNIFKIKQKRSSRTNGQTSVGRTNRSRYDYDIKRIARRYRIDPPLIKAIIHVESDFNHRAVSSHGAQGLMQLMPATARELRVSNPFNPRENIEGGTRYFRKMLDNFKGDLILSLAAYNAGPGRVARAGGVPQIKETRRYVNKVLKRYRAYKAVM